LLLLTHAVAYTLTYLLCDVTDVSMSVKSPPVLQLTKDGMMFQSEWGCDRVLREWFPGSRCSSRRACSTQVNGDRLDRLYRSLSV